MSQARGWRDWPLDAVSEESDGLCMSRIGVAFPMYCSVAPMEERFSSRIQ